MTRAAAFAFFGLCALALCAPASAEWRPPDLRETKASLATVLAAYAQAARTPDPGYAQRRERWTYANGARRLPVRVAVRGVDFRATVTLGGAEYAAGRSEAVRWRADANGITHATLSDVQGDAIDRLPQSIFPFATTDCRLAGESARFGRTDWVLVDRAPRDKPHWFYVDRATGRIAHEITREGAHTIVTSFDRFEPAGGSARPFHWRVSDGTAAHDLDVTVEAVEPQPLGEADVAIPQQQRVFAAPASRGTVVLPSRFSGHEIIVDVDLDGRRTSFVLDTGTASIVLAQRVADGRGWGSTLEHATVPHMAVGPLSLDNVSTLAIPFDGWGGLSGILGYDFFVGHVLHVDYAHQRVDVLDPETAERAFHQPGTVVVSAYFDEGIPLVHAAFGDAAGDRFALDTGSPHLFVMAPFAQRHASEVARWSAGTFARGRRTAEEVYLEGSIVVEAHSVSAFTLGPGRFTDLTVGIEIPNRRDDAIDIPLDGIVGTDELSAFEWWFDYDGGRIALRRNNAH